MHLRLRDGDAGDNGLMKHTLLGSLEFDRSPAVRAPVFAVGAAPDCPRPLLKFTVNLDRISVERNPRGGRDLRCLRGRLEGRQQNSAAVAKNY